MPRRLCPDPADQTAYACKQNLKDLSTLKVYRAPGEEHCQDWDSHYHGYSWNTVVAFVGFPTGDCADLADHPRCRGNIAYIGDDDELLLVYIPTFRHDNCCLRLGEMR